MCLIFHQLPSYLGHETSGAVNKSVTLLWGLLEVSNLFETKVPQPRPKTSATTAMNARRLETRLCAEGAHSRSPLL